LFPNLSQRLTDLQLGGILHVRVKQNEILVFGFGLSESVRIALSQPTNGDGEFRLGLIFAGSIRVDQCVKSQPCGIIVAVLNPVDPTV
jgi:hypothetical protein